MSMHAMPVRCSGCAFTEGTEANLDALTRITKELCLMGRVPFYCHANMVNDVLPADDKRVCHGYLDTVLTDRILGNDPPAWKMTVAREGLRLMEEAEGRAKRGEPEPADIEQHLMDRIVARLGS